MWVILRMHKSNKDGHWGKWKWVEGCLKLTRLGKERKHVIVSNSNRKEKKRKEGDRVYPDWHAAVTIAYCFNANLNDSKQSWGWFTLKYIQQQIYKIGLLTMLIINICYKIKYVQQLFLFLSKMPFLFVHVTTNLNLCFDSSCDWLSVLHIIWSLRNR